jgi:hypothetical protein
MLQGSGLFTRNLSCSTKTKETVARLMVIRYRSGNTFDDGAVDILSGVFKFEKVTQFIEYVREADALTAQEIDNEVDAFYSEIISPCEVKQLGFYQQVMQAADIIDASPMYYNSFSQAPLVQNTFDHQNYYYTVGSSSLDCSFSSACTSSDSYDIGSNSSMCSLTDTSSLENSIFGYSAEYLQQ